MKNKTTLLIKNELNLNASRVKFLTLILSAMMLSGVACLWKLAAYIDSHAKTSSVYRSLQRFMAQVRFQPQNLARLILRLLNCHNQKLILIFDRTNFKVGSTHINLLVLSFAYHNMAIPLVWINLASRQKQGNSAIEDRWKLLNSVIEVIGKNNIWAVLGDREFLGKKWIESLKSSKIAYCMRLKEEWQCIVCDQASKPLIEFLKEGSDEAQALGCVKIGVKEGYVTMITGKRLSKRKAVMVAHSEEIGPATELYRVRWQIEHLFKATKTSGFNFESTGLKKEERVETLFTCIALTLVLAVAQGQIIHTRKPIQKKKHGYLALSIFRKGLNRLRKLMVKNRLKLYQFIRDLLRSNTKALRPPDFSQFFVM